MEIVSQKKPVEIAAGATAVDIHDRVTEAYFGKMGVPFMRETQQRVHWICEQTIGQRVLDVGCSQGITSILLGREGRQVTAVDADERAIEQARAYLAEESERVRANVAFTHGDFLAQEQGQYDTVIIAEVLEHLLQPEGFVQRAAACLPAGGRLVVTVPFGINDFIDHKHTFYLLEPYTFLSSRFEVVDVAILGKWIGFVGRRRADGEAKPAQAQLQAALVAQLESAFFAIERTLRDDLGTVRTQLNDANIKYRAVTEQVATLKQNVAKEETARRDSEATLLALRRQMEQVEKEHGRLNAELQSVRGSASQEKTALTEKATRLETERKGLDQQLTEAQARLKESDAQLETARVALAQAEAGRKAAEDSLAELRLKLAAAEQSVTHLTARAERAESELKEARGALIDAQARLERESTLRAQVLLSESGAQLESVRTALLQAEAGKKSAEDGVVELRLGLALAQQSATHLMARAEKAESELAQARGALIDAQTRFDREVVARTQSLLGESGVRLDAAQAALAQAEHGRKAAEEEMSGLRVKLAAAEQSVIHLAARAEKAESELTDARTSFAAELRSIRDRLQVAEGELPPLRLKLAVSESALAQLEVQRVEAEKRLEAERQASQGEVRRLEDLLGTQRKACIDAEKALAGLESRQVFVLQRLDTAHRQYEGATEQLAVLRRQNAALDEQLAILRKQGISATEQLTALQRHGAGLEAQLADRLRAMELQQQREAALKALLSEREHELGQREDALQALRAEHEQELGQHEDALKALLAEHEEELLQREGVLKSLLAEHEHELELTHQQNRQAIAQLEESEESLREELTGLAHERDGLRTQVAELVVARAADATRMTELEQHLVTAQTDHESSVNLVRALEAQVRQGVDEVAALRAQLLASQNESRDGREALARVTSELGTTQALRRSDQHAAEQMKLQVLEVKKALADSRAYAERLMQQKLAAENQVARTRAMLSFQLGYLLLHGFKSLRAFLALPGQLFALRRETVRRRKSKGQSGTPAPVVAVPLPRSSRQDAPPVMPRIAPPSLQLSAGEDFAQALKTLKVACIMDEFTFASYGPECNLLQLSVAHWKQELEQFVPELLFIESAWRGKDDQWGGRVGHMSEEVVGIVEWCRSRKIPAVFWNKEDPVHFETFLSTAKLFDVVFTTDIDCIHRYKAALGHERVYLLPFACQPESNNPIEKYQRKDAFCFAGAYYVRYPDRTHDLGNFMVALPGFRPVEIYDRNFGKDDPNYQFPPEYQPFIVGNLPYEQIDKAYKGYRYAINLNSIKQSQSMFARRVFELLASNTVTVSNFSRGVRLLFGDLVITTDNGDEVVQRLRTLCNDDVGMRKFRLAGLRKAMHQHTYQDRMAYVVSKVRNQPQPKLLPGVVVMAYAKNQEQLDVLLQSFHRQTYGDRRLLVVVPAGFAPAGFADGDNVQILPSSNIDGLHVGDVAGKSELVAGMVPSDYYGANYLLDMVLATRYASAQVIGKAAYYSWSEEAGLAVVAQGAQYAPARSMPARRALLRPALIEDMPLREWITSLYTRQLEADDILAIDEFNYCNNGAVKPLNEAALAALSDLSGLDEGISAAELSARAENIAPAESLQDEAPTLSGSQLAQYLNLAATPRYRLTVEGAGLEIDSALGDGKHEYLYATSDLQPAELGFQDQVKFYLDVTPGLNVQMVFMFLDAQKQRISAVVKTANRNQEAPIPAGTAWIRLGLRIYGTGSARVDALVLGHRPLRPAEVLGRAEHVVLTNHYPSYDDLYRNGFVHARVAAYAARGERVDVFRLRQDEALSYHEFQNVDVITGSAEALHMLIKAGNYKSVLVHFLDESMWQVLQQHVERLKVLVWVHGSDIRPWHRLEFNYETEQERDAAKLRSETRMAFWRGLLQKMPANLKLIFVSRCFAEEVMEDLGFRLPEDRYEIIHNPIDTDFFTYVPKPEAQRRKILSVRPYASRTYANDLSVKAILALSKKPYFKDLEFRLIGDGKLFDETLEPLRQFSNVLIERRFLTHAEIAALHKEHGIFLCPTRMDSQGVSRDEAMSSGLVPATNRVSAVPEFANGECAVLADGEDADGLAEGIARLVEEPERFLAMSRAAAERVRSQSAARVMTTRELQLFRDGDKHCGWRES